MTMPIDSPGAITPIPPIPTIPTSPTAPTVGPPSASPDSEQSALSARQLTGPTAASSLPSPPTHTPGADTDFTPYLPSRSNRDAKRTASRPAFSGPQLPPTSPRNTPAPPASLPVSSHFTALTQDDDVDISETSGHPSSMTRNRRSANTELSAPRPSSPTDVAMEAACTPHGTHPTGTTQFDAFSFMMPAGPKKRKGAAAQPLPPTPLPPSSPSSSSSSSSSFSSSSSSSPLVTPQPGRPKRNKADPPPPTSQTPSNSRDRFVKTPSTPDGSSSSSAASPASSSHKAKRRAGAGRPVGTGGPLKVTLLQENAELLAQVAHLTALLGQRPAASASHVLPPFTAQQAAPTAAPQTASTTPPPAPLPAPNPVPPPAAHPPPSQALSTGAASSPAPAPGLAPPSSAPKPAAPPAPPQPKAAPRHPALTGDQRARPPQAHIKQMGLPTTSRRDITLFLHFPRTIRGRYTMDRPPRRSNNDSKLVYAFGTLLTKGMGIPAPRLLKALSQHDTVEDLTIALRRTAGSSPQRTAFLGRLNDAITNDLGDTAVGDGLLATPSSEPDSACHSQWYDYLSPNSDTLSTSTSAEGTRHVLRLAFNSEPVAIAIHTHLERYFALLLPSPETHSRAALDAMDQWQRSWVLSAERANATHTRATVDAYTIRYETTQLSGWTRGPDHTPSPTLSEHLDYNELYGSTTRLQAFLTRAAPNCFIRTTESLADGTGIITFVHEAQHRNELYRLQGITSPQDGITRPLRLGFKQLRKPQTQCCAVCGHTGHTAHACPLRAAGKEPAPDDGNMEADDDTSPTPTLGPDAVVCRLCYSPTHRETCHTPPDMQECRICDEKGHTSFRCTRYRPTWVPLTPPPSTHAPNQRPSALIAQQRGLPTPSWSKVAAGYAAPQPAALPPAPSLTDATAFPALPGASYASPTGPPSLATGLGPAPPSQPAPPAPQPSAELVELRAVVATQQRSLDTQQQAIDALLQSNRKLGERFDDLMSLLKRFLPSHPVPMDTPDVSMATSPSLLPPATPVYMEVLDQKEKASTTRPQQQPVAVHQPSPTHNATVHNTHSSLGLGNIIQTTGPLHFACPAPTPPVTGHPPAYPASAPTTSSPPSNQ